MSFIIEFKKNALKLDKFLDRHCTLCFFLLLITILRIPTFFEPYWNIDDSLFLTIGNMLRNGSTLATGILRNPASYLSFLIPNLLTLKLVQYLWLCLSFISFYTIIKKLSVKMITLVSSLFTLLIFTVLPTIDMKVTNGEFFAIGLIIFLGSVCINYKPVSTLIERKKKHPKKAAYEYMFSGLLFLLTMLFVSSNNMAATTLTYYNNWLSYIQDTTSQEQYYQTFNPSMKNTYDVAKIISARGDKNLFIWGDHPNLYALSATIPTSHYLTASEIEVAEAQDKTLEIVTAKQPTFIITMKDNQKSFSGIQTYIHDNYVQYKEYDYFYLYREYQKN